MLRTVRRTGSASAWNLRANAPASSMSSGAANTEVQQSSAVAGSIVEVSFAMIRSSH
jgi:hypothetical protein